MPRERWIGGGGTIDFVFFSLPHPPRPSFEKGCCHALHAGRGEGDVSSCRLPGRTKYCYRSHSNHLYIFRKTRKSLLTARHVEKFMKYPQQERRGLEGISILRASRYIGLTNSIFKVEIDTDLIQTNSN